MSRGKTLMTSFEILWGESRRNKNNNTVWLHIPVVLCCVTLINTMLHTQIDTVKHSNCCLISPIVGYKLYICSIYIYNFFYVLQTQQVEILMHQAVIQR